MLNRSNRKEKQAILTYDNETGAKLTPQALKDFIEQSLDADKAMDIAVVKLEDQAGLADYIVIASGTSSRHVHALASKLKDRLSTKGLKGIHTEGLSQSDWVILDAGDVLVHLFRPEVRDFYNIEKMWGSFPVHTAGTSDMISA